MATEDGAMREGSGPDRPQSRRRPRGAGGRPPELDKDFPWPATWQPNLGPGGEELDDGLVPVGRPTAASDRASEAETKTPIAPASQARRRAPRLRLPIPKQAPLVAGIAGGLIGLAALATAVMPSLDGGTPPSSGERTTITVAAPKESGSTAGERASARQRSARAQETVARRRGAARERLRRERLAERRERDERGRTAPRAAEPVAVTQAVKTPRAPAAPTDPWPGVSPAEREFTPGPWNLS